MSHRSYVVVDASVALKWVLDDEESVGQAIALRDHAIDGRFDMVAPSLWWYEVTNGLVSAVRRGRVPANVAARLLGLLLAVRIILVDPEPAITYRLALDNGISAYDAAYLAVAHSLNAPLWTGDRALQDAATGPRPRVRWIGDYPGA